MRQIKIIGLVFLLLDGVVTYGHHLMGSGNVLLSAENKLATTSNIPSNPYSDYLLDHNENRFATIGNRLNAIIEKRHQKYFIFNNKHCGL